MPAGQLKHFANLKSTEFGGIDFNSYYNSKMSNDIVDMRINFEQFAILCKVCKNWVLFTFGIKSFDECRNQRV